MRTITPLDLRRSLGAILDAASAGERFLVERDHKPVAVIVSVEDAQRIDEDREEGIRRQLEALDRMVERGKRWRAAGVFDGEPTGTELVRWDRDRDEPGRNDEYDEDPDDRTPRR